MTGSIAFVGVNGDMKKQLKTEKKPPNIQIFPATQDGKRLYTKEPRQEEFYVIGTKYLAIFSTKHQNK